MNTKIKIMSILAVLAMMAVCLVPISQESDAADNVLEGMYAGDWSWNETTGLGPYNSFYGAFDIDNGNRFVSILKPSDLSKKIDGTSLGSGNYNIMLVIPTVYWAVDANGDLTLSNDSSAGTAYAHTIDGHVYKYLAIGVYEATSDDNSNPTKLTSETGKTPLASKTRAEFRTLAQAYTMDSSLGTNAYSMLWNFYQWELYKYMALSTMNDFNSQSKVGYGHVYTDNSTYAYTTGATDSLGPYAGKVGTWDSSLGDSSVKLFIENAWGGVREFVDGFMSVSGTTLYIDTSHSPTDATSAGTYVESISFAWPASGYQSGINTSAKLWGLGNDTTGGSDTTGLADYTSKGTSASGNVLAVGGTANSSASVSLQYGLSYSNANGELSHSSAGFGSRVAFVFDADPASMAQKNYAYTIDYDSAAMSAGTNAITTYDTTGATPAAMSAITHDVPTFTVSIASNDTDYGTVDNASVTAAQGTTITVSGNTLTIGSTTVTASKTTPDTAQYTYGFSGWYVGDDPLTSGTLTGNMSVTARFTATVNTYNVTIQSSNTEYGTVDVGAINNTPYGSQIHLSGTNNNILTLNGSVVTATAADPNAYYTYGFDGYSTDGQPVQDGDTITGARTIVANFSQTAIYTVLINPNDPTYGSVSVGSIIGVPTGSTFTVDGDEITIYSVTSQATPASATAKYTYAFDDFYIGNTKVTNGMSVTKNTTVTARFTATVNEYTVSIVAGEGGTVDVASIADVPYDTTITVSDNTVEVDGTTVTATPDEATAQYTYTFDHWSVANGATTDDDTIITAYFAATVNTYTITWDIDGVTEETEWAYGSTPTHAVPVKEGYYFAGWDPTVVAVTEDATYTATWGEGVLTTLAYNSTGGSEVASSTFWAEPNTHVTFTVTSTVPTQSQFTFKGWATTADGDAEYHAGDSFVMTAGDSQTLYAVWGDPVEYETLMTLVDAIPLIMIAGLIVTIVGTVFIGRYVGMSIEDMVRLVLGACIAVLFVVAIAIPIISGL